LPFEVKIKFAVLASCVALLTAALPLPAHDSIAAEYDNSEAVSIKGKAVSRMARRNGGPRGNASSQNFVSRRLATNHD
jgi:hypothetical protein